MIDIVLCSMATGAVARFMILIVKVREKNCPIEQICGLGEKLRGYKFETG